jgi:hypothetical protein
MNRCFQFLLLATTLAACGPKDATQTGDETRSAATEIRPGTTVDDKVSSSADPVDWKKFDVESKTEAMVTIYWDNPSIKAETNVRDMFGGIVATLSHTPGAAMDQVKTTLKDGSYYLELKALSGTSVYTVELVLGGETNPYGVPRPE